MLFVNEIKFGLCVMHQKPCCLCDRKQSDALIEFDGAGGVGMQMYVCWERGGWG